MISTTIVMTYVLSVEAKLLRMTYEKDKIQACGTTEYHQYWPWGEGCMVVPRNSLLGIFRLSATTLPVYNVFRCTFIYVMHEDGCCAV
jgi:hypothetical protein